MGKLAQPPSSSDGGSWEASDLLSVPQKPQPLAPVSQAPGNQVYS